MRADGKIVKNHVAEPRADKNSCDNPGDEAVQLFFSDADAVLLVGLPNDHIARGEGEKIHETVPMHRKTAQLQGDSVKVGGN